MCSAIVRVHEAVGGDATSRIGRRNKKKGKRLPAPPSLQSVSIGSSYQPHWSGLWPCLGLLPPLLVHQSHWPLPGLTSMEHAQGNVNCRYAIAQLCVCPLMQMYL